MKAQALEGYLELGAPTLIGAARARKPNSIPLFIDLAIFDDEAINERTQRVGGKVEGVTPVAEAIDENLYAVICREIGITRHLCADNLLRIRVEAHYADIETLAVIKQLYFCRLCCPFALVRLALPYLPDRCCCFPVRLV